MLSAVLVVSLRAAMSSQFVVFVISITDQGSQHAALWRARLAVLDIAGIKLWHGTCTDRPCYGASGAEDQQR